MHDIRLIATDMDGTLLNSAHEVSDRNAAAILAAQKKGVVFALCTGRLPHFGVLHMQHKGITCPVIGANGGLIWDDRVNKTVATHPMSAQIATEVSELLQSYGLLFYAFTAENIVSSDEKINHPNAAWRDGEMTRVYGIPFGGGKEKMRIATGKGQTVKFFVSRQPDELHKEISTKLQKIKGIYVTSSGKNCFEIMREDVNKCTGVQALAAMYGIKMENVMTFGDYDNDMPMIRAAGMGVAMGNALQSVKDSADYVTDTNDNDGIATAIEKFVL